MKTITLRSTLSIAALALLAVAPATAPAAKERDTYVTTVMMDNVAPREGSGRTGSVRRELPAFSRIELRSAQSLKVVRGDASRLVLTGDDNLLELVTTEVRGDSLIVDARGSYRTTLPMRIEVTLPALRKLTLAGSGDAALTALDPQGFELALEGSGDVMAEGRVQKLTVTLDGSGTVDFTKVTAKSTRVDLNGSGDVRLGEADQLRATINGSGDIVYAGQPRDLKQSVLGSGSIRWR